MCAFKYCSVFSKISKCGEHVLHSLVREKNGLSLQSLGLVWIRIPLIADLGAKETYGTHTLCLSPVTASHLSPPEVVHQCSGSQPLLLIQGFCLWVHPLSPALSISPSLRLFPSTFQCTNYTLNPVSSHQVFPNLIISPLVYTSTLTGLFLFSTPTSCSADCSQGESLEWKPHEWGTPCLVHHCISSVRKIPSTL